ncbi:MAG: lactate racemase domain-containing protein, partial [Fimbriiglobus sp.]
MKIPPVQLVRQIAPQSKIADVAAETRRVLLESPLAKRIRPGMSVAVGCGSRGIRNYLPLAKSLIAALQELGAKPFAVAAMGSHGGATAAGQRDLLGSFGITPENLGVPVVTDMDAVDVGTNSWGQPVWWDKNAFAADGVILLNRIKPHTDFRGRYESGILKMLVIGLGKRHGADQVHSFGTRGLRDMLVESAKVLLEKSPFLGGIGVLENANEETAKIVAIDRDDVLAQEPPLLEEAKRIMGRI